MGNDGLFYRAVGHIDSCIVQHSSSARPLSICFGSSNNWDPLAPRMSSPPPKYHAHRPIHHEKPWSGPVQRDPDRLVHHVSKLPQILEAALDPKATIEKMLWGATTLRRCIETSDERGRRTLRANSKVLPTLTYLFRAADASDTGARILEHVLLGLLHLLGEDPKFDEECSFDNEIQQTVLDALMDNHVVVVLAGMQVVRRMSENPLTCKWLLYNDALFNQILELLELCDEPSILTHGLSSLLNMSSNEALNFPLARCGRLLQLLLEIVSQEGSDPRLVDICVKTFANLLSFPDNVAEVLRIVPSITNVMIELSSSANMELAVASRHVLQFIHEGDFSKISTQIVNEFAEGRAVALRLRSPLLTPHQGSGSGDRVDRNGGGLATGSKGPQPVFDDFYSESPSSFRTGSVDPNRPLPSALDRVLNY
jgi:hypothetical protein